MQSTDIPVSTFESAMKQFDDAARLLHLDKGLLEVVKRPRRSILLEIPVTMDDGTLRIFKAYRVQHSIIRGVAGNSVGR